MKPMGRKGSAWSWIIILIAMFITGLVWLVFTNPMEAYLFPITEQALDTMTFPNGSVANKTAPMQTLNLLRTMWHWWPVIAWIGFIITGFVLAQRREPDQSIY